MRAAPSEETILFPPTESGDDRHSGSVAKQNRVALQETQARLEAELADLKLLQAVSAELISEHDIHALYQKLVNAAVSIMRSDFASMQMFYPERGASGALRLLASHGFNEEAQQCWEWVSHETASSCGEVLRSGGRVIATNVEECEFLIRLGGLQAYLAAGIHSMQSTPLISRSGKLVGMISTHWREPHEPSERDLRLFDILVRQAADVVERTRAEESLRQSEERLAADLQAMTQLYELGNVCAYAREHRAQCLDAILEVALNLTHAARGTIQLTDHRSGALVIEAHRSFSQAFLDFFGGPRGHASAICNAAIEKGQRVIVEDITKCDLLRDQPSLSVLLGEGVHAMQSTPLISSTGNILGMISTHFSEPRSPEERELRMLDLLARQAADYLERMDAEAKLRDSQERYRNLFDSIDQGFCTIKVLFDDTGKAIDYQFLLVNPAFERQTGIRDATGRRMREIAPLHEEHWFETYGRIALTGESRRFENAATQLGRSYEAYAWRIGAPEEHKVGILFNDISDRKRADESERRLAAIVEHSKDAIISIDLDAVIRSWNQGAERLYGYTAKEAIGRPVSVLIPENRENEEPNILNRIQRGETVEHYETVRRRKDGSLVDISLTVSPLKDASGRIVGASKVARDITEKVRSRETLERTVTERTAMLSDTVAELEAFSYSIAHDMRAPLRAMHGYARFVEEDFAEMLPQEGKEFLHRISSGAGRLDRLITDVLNYSKISRGEMGLEKIDVEKLTREIVDTYADLSQSGATILIQSPMPPVVANAAALTQCISNLLSNAVKFVAVGKKAQVRVRAETHDHIVRISVEDNGIGIDKEGQKRIFRMFQRLNPATNFEGTGIGLTIVRKAVERMGGCVGVESEPGEGSVFWIELKLAK
ncbi:MAG TPA: PAS domain S-box protein [Verrucomicrobiae bacterium]|jgi:PAS domain S-box-containing protein|nr:PAS domain S-box protein [Verrucomicrobiae bacterium]